MGSGCVYPYPSPGLPLKEDMMWMGYPHDSEDSYAISKRAIVQFKRSLDLGMFFIFLTQNFNLKNEVLEKYDLPYADNLDEMPK